MAIRPSLTVRTLITAVSVLLTVGLVYVASTILTGESPVPLIRSGPSGFFVALVLLGSAIVASGFLITLWQKTGDALCLVLLLLVHGMPRAMTAEFPPGDYFGSAFAWLIALSGLIGTVFVSLLARWIGRDARSR